MPVGHVVSACRYLSFTFICKTVDVLIVGGGIMGLATAYRLTRGFPQRTVTLLEKETGVGSASNRAQLWRITFGHLLSSRQACELPIAARAKSAMEQFCVAEGIAYKICGKVIVAMSEAELPALANIFERGQANGVKCEMIDRARLTELEPHTAGIRAIHVPETGIVDYPAVCQRLAQRIREAGGQIVCSARVKRRSKPKRQRDCRERGGRLSSAQYVVTCAGLQSDRVAKLSGPEVEPKIVPFRGEYFELKPEAELFVPHFDLPRARSKFSIFRRAFHAADSWRSGVRTQCRVGVCAGRLSKDAIFHCAIWPTR